MKNVLSLIKQFERYDEGRRFDCKKQLSHHRVVNLRLILMFPKFLLGQTFHKFSTRSIRPYDISNYSSLSIVDTKKRILKFLIEHSKCSLIQQFNQQNFFWDLNVKWDENLSVRTEREHPWNVRSDFTYQTKF